MPTKTPAEQSQYILAEEITQRIRVHLSTLTRWVESDWFPAPIRLGPSGRHRRWRRDVVEACLRQLEEASDEA
jgi:predicted DNA-binding transcriptional regulator AlpA